MFFREKLIIFPKYLKTYYNILYFSIVKKIDWLLKNVKKTHLLNKQFKAAFTSAAGMIDTSFKNLTLNTSNNN